MTDPGLAKHRLTWLVVAIDPLIDADCLDEIDHVDDVEQARETLATVRDDLEAAYPDATLADPFGGANDGD